MEIVLSAAGGAIVILFTQAAIHYFQTAKLRKEKLLDKYSEFIGLASQEKHRAERMKAWVDAVTNLPDGDESLKGKDFLLQLFEKLEEQRFHHWSGLERLELQILLWERNPDLRQKVAEIVKTQLFILPGKLYITGPTRENYAKYIKDIESFGTKLRELSETIQRIHTANRMSE